MKNIYLFFALLLFGWDAYSQVQTNELPPSFLSSKIQSVENTIAIPAPSVSPLLAEDKIDESQNNKPWRFGTLIPVDYSIENSGSWQFDKALGMDVWKLSLTCPEAISLNLNFNRFFLEEGVKLFIYTDKKNMIGAITSANNKENGLFSTRPLHGNKITLELYTPPHLREKNILSIEGLVYGYKDFQEKINKVFQSSGSCNVNVNCPEGDDWADQKRSVALITSASNTRFCSGVLLNNVRQDTTPFILTAAHCNVRDNSIFIFGYQSPNCSPNIDGQLTNSISGSRRLSTAPNSHSDFNLRLLSTRPPSSYNVFYAGWSAVNTPADNTVSMHHPAGDVMKIAVDNDPVIESGYYRSGETHWQVTNWEVGTTEGGSSGAPLFDQNQRVVGQLNGGDASCSLSAQDYYGKFSYSWDNFPDSSRQLQYWLDPDNTGTLIVDGLDPNPAPFANDLHLLDILGVSDNICASFVQPTVLVRNVGNETVNSFAIRYRISNGDFQTHSVTTSLSRNQIEEVILPTVPLNFGVNNFYAEVLFNTALTDSNSVNNSDSVTTFANTSPNPEFIVVTLRTDDFGSELSWNITNRNTSKILASGSGYNDVAGGQLFRDTFCIYNGCYDLDLFDNQGDGFDGNFGDGFLLITNSLSDTLINSSTFTEKRLTDNFCITTNNLPTSLDERRNTNELSFEVFPNPISKGQHLRLTTDEVYSLKLYDIQGRLVQESQNTNVLFIKPEYKSGLYLLEILDSNNNIPLGTKKVLIN